MAARTTFGTTWWGQAWIDALERSARLDPSRLGRGRSYARDGSVRDLVVAKGYVAAQVSGSHRRYYRTDVAVKQLADSEWEQVADAIATRAGHAAALLDGVLEPALVDDALAVDVHLLPGAGDLRPDCTCPDWAEPCKHAAALCYLVANELDRDPFQLFLLRGRSRDELMAMVRERRTAGGASAEPIAEPGVDGAVAWSAAPLGSELSPVPDIVATAARPGRAPLLRGVSLGGELPLRSGLDVDALDELADDAARRAWSMLVDGAPSGLLATREVDLSRRAATIVDRRELAGLAALAGVPAARLSAWAEAWRRSGDAGARVVADDGSWSHDAERLEQGRRSLVEYGYSQRSIGLGWNHLRMQQGAIGLVLGPDDCWYRLQFTESRDDRHLLGGPATDVCDLVDPPPR
jgi:uncharacterized Zn finger protein